MRTSGTAWHSGATVDQAMSSARSMYGRGYRVTLVRSKPDTIPGGVLALARWEIVDQDAVDEEYARRNEPLTGLQVQAMAYLVEESGW